MDAAIGLAVILLLGVGSQWFAWRIRIPSILILLLCGFIVGPISTLRGEGAAPLLDPDALFGDILLPLVSISVGLILYEGGLTLRFDEIKKTKRALWNLCSIGAAVTWVGSSAAAYFLVDGLTLEIAILLGAILVVTGPTVIGPLLSHIRPTGPAAPVLKWEGIVIDPIGASLAVIVFEVILATQAGDGAFGQVASALGKTLLAGGGLGILAALLLRETIRRHWAPEFLQNPVSLAVVVLTFVICDKIQKESGLLATTVMGIVLANQKAADMRHIIEFKENLRVLLISSLFIVLGSRLDIASLQTVGLGSVFLVLALLLVIRPLSVFASTWSAGFAFRDKAFVSWMAPRGIVAAAVASVFGAALEERGVESAGMLVPLIFIVIIGTVATYGLTTPILAKRLGLADQNPQGVIILGAHSWARAFASVLDKRGVRVVLLDTNRDNIREARMAGLATARTNILSEHGLDDLDLTGYGRFIALTPNDEVNALACQRFGRVFARQDVFQLPSKVEQKKDGAISREFQGRPLFDGDATFQALASRLSSGHIIKATTLSETFTYSDYRKLYGPRAVPLLVIGPGEVVRVVSSDAEGEPEPGQTLISFVDPDDLLFG